MSVPGRILLIEDDPGICDTLRRVLVEEGHEVVVDSRGDDGLTRAGKLSFNAVITDERMPGMTGSALVGAIRAIRHDVPIMLMSGFVGGGLAVRARAFGVNDVLKKPLSRHDLAASLARVLVRQSEAR